MTFGFIGVGNMGGAVAKAVCRQVGGEAVCITRINTDKLPQQAAQLGCAHSTAREIAQNATYIFLGVKPQMMRDILEELQTIFVQRTTPFVLISMAAGMNTAQISTLAGGDYPVIRIMPNTPVSIGCGMTLYCKNNLVSDQDLQVVIDALAKSGQLDDLPEHLFDVGTVVGGCSPAFVDLFIEAMADGGVACGLPRQKAMAYAAQAVYGTAKLVQESGDHPGVLKDAVCSPGGSTIQGVRALEAGGFRSATMEAVVKAYEKTQNLGK